MRFVMTVIMICIWTLMFESVNFAIVLLMIAELFCYIMSAMMRLRISSVKTIVVITYFNESEKLFNLKI